jgi:hypothetical protein
LRSPTILWLYLIACGVPPEDARVWIQRRSPDAAPGSRRLADDEHIRFAREHGQRYFRPLPRPEIVSPVGIGE